MQLYLNMKVSNQNITVYLSILAATIVNDGLVRVEGRRLGEQDGEKAEPASEQDLNIGDRHLKRGQATKVTQHDMDSSEKNNRALATANNAYALTALSEDMVMVECVGGTRAIWASEADTLSSMLTNEGAYGYFDGAIFRNNGWSEFSGVNFDIGLCCVPDSAFNGYYASYGPTGDGISYNEYDPENSKLQEMILSDDCPDNNILRTFSIQEELTPGVWTNRDNNVGDATLWTINSFRRHADGTMKGVDLKVWNANAGAGEVREEKLRLRLRCSRGDAESAKLRNYCNV